MVVYVDGEPDKSKYRKYKVHSDQNDDYHTMKEVIYRRYYHGLIDKDFDFYSKMRTRSLSIPHKVKNYILKKFN